MGGGGGDTSKHVTSATPLTGPRCFCLVCFSVLWEPGYFGDIAGADKRVLGLQPSQMWMRTQTFPSPKAKVCW